MNHKIEEYLLEIIDEVPRGGTRSKVVTGEDDTRMMRVMVERSPQDVTVTIVAGHAGTARDLRNALADLVVK